MGLIEQKAAPVLEIKALDDETGVIEGYASTFGGEPDAYGDIIAPGAFKDSLAEHKAKGSMPKLFWQHSSFEPIGRWTEAREDDRGLLVKGQLNLKVQRGAEALALLKGGDIDGLSIGYRIKEYVVDADTQVWTLQRLDLIEVSVVSTPANENATIGSVKAAKAAHELTQMLKAGDQLTERQFENWLKGLGFSNAQAERAARLHLKGQGDLADADEEVARFLAAMQG